MRWAVAEDHRTDNPAGDVLSSVLPRGSSPPVHHAALPHAQVARALARMRAAPGYPSSASSRLFASKSLSCTSPAALRADQMRSAALDALPHAGASVRLKPRPSAPGELYPVYRRVYDVRGEGSDEAASNVDSDMRNCICDRGVPDNADEADAAE